MYSLIALSFSWLFIALLKSTCFAMVSYFGLSIKIEKLPSLILPNNQSKLSNFSKSFIVEDWFSAIINSKLVHHFQFKYYFKFFFNIWTN